MRFIRNVAVPFAGDDCLIWPYARNGAGYACQVKIGDKRRPACQVVCEIAHGPAPTDEHETAHSCGKGHEGCVNPRHLRWATKLENAADKQAHGTTYRGERHFLSKLTESDVRDIRRLQGKHSQETIGKMFGISQVAVSCIFRGRTWSWLSD